MDNSNRTGSESAQGAPADRLDRPSEAFAEMGEGVCAKFLHDLRGWRFVAWEYAQRPDGANPVEPAAEDKAARFTTFDEALTHFRERYESLPH